MAKGTVTRESVAQLPFRIHYHFPPGLPQVVVFNRGLIEQQGTPTEIIKKPRTPFIMKFVGETNVVPSTCLVGAAGAPLQPRVPRAWCRCASMKSGGLVQRKRAVRPCVVRQRETALSGGPVLEPNCPSPVYGGTPARWHGAAGST